MKKNEKKLVNLPSDTDIRQMKMTKKDMLDRHDFLQLDDRNPSVSLKTWMVNGFRFVYGFRLFTQCTIQYESNQ